MARSIYPSSEFTLQTLWFAVPDSQGRPRSGVLCGAVWMGEWPLSAQTAEALIMLPEGGSRVVGQVQGGLDELRARISHPERLSQSVLARFTLAELKQRAGALAGHLSYSISHSSRTAVVLGFEAPCCGVDLELGAVQDRPAALVKKFASPDELALLAPSRLSPWALWCAKEALGKARGTGLEAPLSRFAISSARSGVLSFAGFDGMSARAWDLSRSQSRSAHLAIVLPDCTSDPSIQALEGISIHDWAGRLFRG